MIWKIFVRMFAVSLMVSVLVSNYRVAMLEEKMKSVYQSLANLHAERRAAIQADRKQALGMAEDVNRLQDLAKDYGKPPMPKDHYP